MHDRPTAAADASRRLDARALTAAGRFREARAAWEGLDDPEAAAERIRAAVVLGEAVPDEVVDDVEVALTAAWARGDAAGVAAWGDRAAVEGRGEAACRAHGMQADAAAADGRFDDAFAALARAAALAEGERAQTRSRRAFAVLEVRSGRDGAHTRAALRELVADALRRADRYAEALCRAWLAVSLVDSEPFAAGVEAAAAARVAATEGYARVRDLAAPLARLLGPAGRHDPRAPAPPGSGRATRRADRGSGELEAEPPEPSGTRVVDRPAAGGGDPALAAAAAVRAPADLHAVERALAMAAPGDAGWLARVVTAGLRGRGFVRAVAGGPASLVFGADDVWVDGEARGELRGPSVLFRLLQQIALGAADRQDLYERVWEEPYRPPSSDSKLYMAVTRLRERAGVAIEAARGYRLAASPAVWCHAPVPTPAVAELPALDTAFFGRDDELGALAAALAAAALVTLHGPPGAGKTRLAREHAWQAARGGQPVVLVELAGASTEAAALDRVGTALSLGAAISPATVGHALAALGPALVVLDDLDRLVGVIEGPLGTWLALAPRCRFVATSRAPLGLGAAVEVGALAEGAALALFEDRARRTVPSFQAQDRAAARELVRALDALPLAIELAAARMGVLTPRALLERVDRQLALLARPDGDPRHRSLRGALDVSWELLDADHRAALTGCAVFEAPFTVDDAEAVLAAPAIDAVEHLWRAGLLYRRVDRFGLYAAVRAYAPEPDVAARIRHGRRFVDLARGRSPNALAALREDLIAAHRHLRDVDPGLSTEAAAALLPLVRAAGPLASRLALLDSALDVAVGPARAPFLLVRAQTLGQLGREADSVADLSALLAGDPDDDVRAEALLYRGHVHGDRADVDAALALAERSADPAVRGFVFGAWAVLRTHDDPERAEATLRRSIAALQLANDASSEGHGWTRLGSVLWTTGRHAEALDAYHRAIARLSDVGDEVHLRHALGSLGNLYIHLGQLDEARRRLEEAHALHRRLGDVRNAAVVRVNLAHAALHQGDLEACLAHGVAAAEVLREREHPEALVAGLSHVGCAWQELGKWRSAEENLRAALDAAGSRWFGWTVHAHLGALLHERGDLDGAAEAYAAGRAGVGALADRRVVHPFDAREVGLGVHRGSLDAAGVDAVLDRLRAGGDAIHALGVAIHRLKVASGSVTAVAAAHGVSPDALPSWEARRAARLL